MSRGDSVGDGVVGVRVQDPMPEEVQELDQSVISVFKRERCFLL